MKLTKTIQRDKTEKDRIFVKSWHVKLLICKGHANVMSHLGSSGHGDIVSLATVGMSLIYFSDMPTFAFVLSLQ